MKLFYFILFVGTATILQSQAPPVAPVPCQFLADLPGDVWYRPKSPDWVPKDALSQVEWHTCPYGSWQRIESVHSGEVLLYGRWLSPRQVSDDWEYTKQPFVPSPVILPVMKVVP